MRHHRACAAGILLIVSLQPTLGLARTWYIRPDGSGDAPTIQAGIDSATAGDDVLVAAGDYSWASQGMATDLYGPTMIEVGPDIRLHSESGASATVLDAQEQGRVLVCRFCTAVEGFTITNGRTLRNESYGGYGGGIFILGGEPLVADNIVLLNYAEGGGGGIGRHGGRGPRSSPVIRDNSVLWNTAGYRTGGIEISGGDSTLVENNTVVGNSGGGIACIQCGATFARNIIADSGRSADGLVDGFGMFCILFEGEGDSLFAECNLLWNNSGGNAICGTDGGDNLISDPKFCISVAHPRRPRTHDEGNWAQYTPRGHRP